MEMERHGREREESVIRGRTMGMLTELILTFLLKLLDTLFPNFKHQCCILCTTNSNLHYLVQQ